MQLTITPDHAVNAYVAFEEFKKTHDIGYVLAFSGGADDSNSLTKAAIQTLHTQIPDLTLEEAQKIIADSGTQMIRTVVDDLLRPLRGFKIAIQTGGTKWGVPKVAMQTAKELGFTTIGIYPLAATVGKDRTLPDELVDLKISVHPGLGETRWGDESPHFAHCLDGAIVIGGGAGTMVEVAHLLKINEARDLVHKKMIIPIIGTGGTADQVMSFPGKPHVMSACLPATPITEGGEASRFLRQYVFTDRTYADVYDVFPHDYLEGDENDG